MNDIPQRNHLFLHDSSLIQFDSIRYNFFNTIIKEALARQQYPIIYQLSNFPLSVHFKVRCSSHRISLISSGVI